MTGPARRRTRCSGRCSPKLRRCVQFLPGCVQFSGKCVQFSPGCVQFSGRICPVFAWMCPLGPGDVFRVADDETLTAPPARGRAMRTNPQSQALGAMPAMSVLTSITAGRLADSARIKGFLHFGRLGDGDAFAAHGFGDGGEVGVGELPRAGPSRAWHRRRFAR